MKNLLKYFRGSRIRAILAPLLKMTEASLELIVPLIIAKIIDIGIPSGDKSYIIKLCLLLIAFGLFGFGISITAQYFSADASVSTVRRIRHAAFEKLLKLDFSDMEKTGTGTLTTRLTSDMDSLQTGINLTLRLLLRSPFVVFGAAIMAFTVDKKAAVTFAVIIPLLAIIIFAVFFATRPLFKKVRSGLDKLLITVRENLMGVRVIRAFGAEERCAEEFECENDSLTSLQNFTGRISAITNPATMVIINLGIAVLIYTGAIRVKAGVISCGCVVALYNYMTQILTEMVKFANLIVTVTKATAAGDRIAQFLDIPENSKEYEEFIPDETQPQIKFENVSFAYPDSPENSIENISFEVKKGQRIGVIGSTGSGKSTLVNLIPGYFMPTGGNIFFYGKKIEDISPALLRNKVAFVEQKPFMFEGTIRSNMLIAKPDATDDEIISALKKAQAYDFVMNKSKGIDEEVEQGGRNFSGGQRQRLAVARALLKESEIIILDDASGSLDYSTDALMRKAIFEDTSKTIITVSQRTGSIMNCDKIIMLEDGKADIGTHFELLSSNENYREIHLSQFEEEDEK